MIMIFCRSYIPNVKGRTKKGRQSLLFSLQWILYLRLFMVEVDDSDGIISFYLISYIRLLSYVNSSVPNAPFLYPLKTENVTVF